MASSDDAATFNAEIRFCKGILELSVVLKACENVYPLKNHRIEISDDLSD